MYGLLNNVFSVKVAVSKITGICHNKAINNCLICLEI